MKMPWGKYGPIKNPPNGVDIAFINSGYLKWLLEQDWFLDDEKNELLILAFEDELKYRDQNNCHFYGEDKITVGWKSDE